MIWIAKGFFDFDPCGFANQFGEFDQGMREGRERFSFWFRKKGTKFVFAIEPNLEHDGSAPVSENLFEFVVGLYRIELIKASTQDGRVWYDAWVDGEPGILNEPQLETLLRKVWAKYGSGPLKV